MENEMGRALTGEELQAVLKQTHEQKMEKRYVTLGVGFGCLLMLFSCGAPFLFGIAAIIWAANR